MAEKVFYEKMFPTACVMPSAFLDSAESFTSCPAFAGMTKNGGVRMIDLDF
jgi:hypothetical protein